MARFHRNKLKNIFITGIFTGYKNGLFAENSGNDWSTTHGA